MPHTRKQKTRPDTVGEQTNGAQSDAGATAPQDDIDRARRRLHDALSFWMICEEKACKRARACRGDTYACSRRHQPLVPQGIKVWLKKAIDLRLEELSPEEAARGATEHVAAYEARQAEIEARFAAARGDGAADGSLHREADAHGQSGDDPSNEAAGTPRVRAL